MLCNGISNFKNLLPELFAPSVVPQFISENVYLINNQFIHQNFMIASVL